ncbi:MAG: transposase zinc-binding domain-containing protein, partial [Desulfobulbaceae bacterium]|nr:transposase zinc-binding domain-containing protein [Desulfobulbaceae bacterium]
MTNKSRYIPKSRNIIQQILKEHFGDFEECFEEKYAKTYGSSLSSESRKLSQVFLAAGTTIRVSPVSSVSTLTANFRPFSCKTWYLCPSCHQKRILLFFEHLDRDVLLKLPHRQFVFAIPKALRVFFRYNQNLFSYISRMIFKLIQEYFNEAAGKSLNIGAIISFQSFGDTCADRLCKKT